jgi:glycosyltransferase involved in cell wall biosynthesis
MKQLYRFDIIHVHLFPAQYWVVLAAIFSRYKGKIIFTEHSTSNFRKRIWFFKYIDRWIYSYYERIICISDEIMSINMDYLGLDKNRLSIISNGIDLKNIEGVFGYKKEVLGKDIKMSDFVIMQVASFRYPKDPFTLIKAMASSPIFNKLILVGDGPQRDDIEALIVELKLEKRVFLLGIRMDVIALMKTADCLVLSSAYEGVPISCLEAMASETPFIGANVKGINKIVSELETLFEYQNIEEFNKLVNKLQTNLSFREKVVFNAKKQVQKYSLVESVSNTIAIYNEVYEIMIIK